MNTKYIITYINDRLCSAQFTDDRCVELHVLDNNGIIGNVYIGRVENVLKNINGAFIEIQKGVKAYYSLEDNKRHLFLNRKNNTTVNQGDFLLVQATKEAVKTKPGTVSSKISFQGSYVVIASDVDGVHISGKTKKSPVCRELKSILEENFDFNIFASDEKIAGSEDAQNIMKLGNYGFILRTNSANADIDLVLNEAKELLRVFEAVIRSALYSKPLTQLYSAQPDYLTNLQDIRSKELTEIITDVDEVYNLLSQTTLASKLRFYNDYLLPLGKLYSLENELELALRKKVWLKCGGYLVIEQTEALTVIDVNSGKYISKKQGSAAKEAAFSKINMEAAAEIAVQLRLRNLSGIIIVDFISMKDTDNNSELLSYLRNLFKDDSTTTSVVDITKLGLVEITRMRSGKTLAQQINSDNSGAADNFND